MVMLATHYDFVIGGDPDRDTMDLAVLGTATGGVIASISDTAVGDGYIRMLTWARDHAPGRRVWALEGTGSFTAGFVAVLAGAGEDVVEITGGKWRRVAKNDRIDAIQAARAALSSQHQATPRSRGLREALRQVMATRRAVLVSRTKAINELKSLIVVAPEYLRAPLRGCSLQVQLRRIEGFLSPAEAGVEHRITVFTMQSITARIRFLFAQTAELDPQLLALVKQHPAGPTLLAEPGVGPVSASQLLISWSHHGRVSNESAFAALAGVAPLEASSGQRTRHRLNRGGDRDLNRALHAIAITNLRCHPESKQYEINRIALGKTHREIRCSLKRALARRLLGRIESATHLQPDITPLSHPAGA